ncbi:hypothetical protein SLA2020_106650 [Shorea laevis]
MPAKLLNSHPDDHQNLQKQIGCINGLFQHFLGGRRVIGQNHKRLPPGPDSSSHGMEPKNASEKKTANNVKKSMKEKQRASTGSSRAAISSTSSCSSSHTSADCNGTPLTPRSSLTQTNFPETPTRNLSSYRSNVALPLSKSLDLRDVVKDSIRRETRGLSIKTTTKHESGQQTLKHIDSPRPLQSPRSTKTKGPAHNDSLRVLAKLQEVPRASSERKDGSLAFTPRDAPRFSYDERVSQDTIKIKLKELPRLSLDGKLHRRNVDSSDMENQQQEPGSYRGPSSIVAKLMGLDSLSNSMAITGNQTWDIKTCSDGKEQSPATDDSKQNPISSSPRKASKEPISVHLRRADSAKTPISSKCPIEPAPWKHPDLNEGQKPPSKYKETPVKAPNSSLTVYGEIERRLAQLDFKKSGKDLRALKQILEAMQKSKQRLENRKEGQASNFGSQDEINSNLDQNLRFANFSSLEINTTSSATNKGTTSPRKSRTTVMIMKPAKFVERASSPTSSVSTTDSVSRLRTRDPSNPRRGKVGEQSAEEVTPRHNHLRDPCSQLHPTEKNNVRSPRLIQASKVPSCKNQEIQRSSMSSDSISLKLQQKKLEMEKHSSCTASRSEQSRRRQPSRQQTESSTPFLKPQHKSPSLWQYDHQLNDVSSYLRDFSHQEDASSVQSETKTSLVSTTDNEVTSTNKSSKISSTLFPQQKEKWNNPTARLLEEGSIAEPIKVALEQPSPVSVLDATFYGDESPSPVKKISNAFKDDVCLNPDEVEWSSRNSDSKELPDCKSSSHEHDYGKVENIQRLVQKAIHVESTHEESITKEILPINNGTNPDHKYISEILLASDILRERESGPTIFQFHPSGKPINPSLFLVLEQTKTSTWLSNHKRNGQRINLTETIQRDRRKLIFDAVNELLASKLPKEGSWEQWLSSNKLADRRPGGQQLLRDLCREIDCLNANSYCSLDDEDDSPKDILWEDLKHRSVEWTVFQNELPWVVLDLERLVFKDLITEVLGSVAANLRERPGRHCRQLFPS